MCESCQKNEALIKEQRDEIIYLKALIALDSIKVPRNESKPEPQVVNALHQTRLLQNQLLVIRADVQYLNAQMQAALEWTAKVISIFLSCCGRVPQSTAAMVVAH